MIRELALATLLVLTATVAIAQTSRFGTADEAKAMLENAVAANRRGGGQATVKEMGHAYREACVGSRGCACSD
jgi:hypothetical protein